MVLGEPEATQVQIKGMKLKNIINKDFVSFIEKEFEKPKFVYMRIVMGEKEEDEKRRGILIGHFRPEHEKNDIIDVDVDTPEDMEKIISILKKYDEGC